MALLKSHRFKPFSEKQFGLEETTTIDDLMYRRLDISGNPIDESPELPVALLKTMWAEMMFGRIFDEQASKLSTFRVIGTYAPYRGQEAAQAGVALALGKDDWFVPMYRDSMAVTLRGLEPEKILLYWAGDERGMLIPEGVNMLPFSIAVGTQIPHASGLALAQKIKGTGSAVLVTTGDGGTSKGDFHEGMNMAGTFHLPLVAVVENNQYAISVPRTKQTASKTIAQKAVSYGFEGLLVDGNDAIAVYEATDYALQKARNGEGPTLLELYTYRMGVHTTAELVSHKLQPPEEIEEWQQRDPILRLERYMMSRNLLSEQERSTLLGEMEKRVRDAVDAFRKVQPPDALEMFNYTYDKPTPDIIKEMNEDFQTRLPTPDIPDESIPEGGKPNVNIRNAINMALRQELERDKRIVVFGEDVGRNGGVFQVTKGLQEEFGSERVFDTPLSELGIAGLFFGLSVGGMIPVAEFQFEGFTPPAYDQLVTHISRIRNRSRGRFFARGVIRFPYGGGLHAPELHLDSNEAIFCHTPGLKVVVPSNPIDAKGLLASALEEENPVIFMEPKRYYDSPRLPVPEERYKIPIGKAKVLRTGVDVTVITYGAMVWPTLEAVDALSSRGDCKAEVIELRTLSPMDFSTVRTSVERTGRAVVVHEAPRNLGVGAEVAARITDECLLSLKAPVKRVTGYDIVNPLSLLQKYYIPTPERIANSIKQLLSY